MSTVHTQQGLVKGEWVEEVIQYRGIPYAELPGTAEGRFKPPVPPRHRDSVLSAARSSKKIPQA